MTSGPGARSGDVLVVGASISGMVTALALARRGIPVQLVDADPAADVHPAGGDAAAALDEPVRRTPRRATPQAGHSHAFLARCRALLGNEAPDVLDDLRQADCPELTLADHRAETVPAHTAHPDTADLVVIAARRTTFEAVLRRAVGRRPEVRRLPARRASGLVVEGGGAVPHVRGVRFDDGTVTPARLVVDATGRRTSMPAWLAGDGVVLSEAAVECGIFYLTRFYRREPSASALPLDRGFAAGGSFDRYSCLVFPGDAGTFSVTFGVLPEDRALRGLLRDGAGFDAAVRSIPSLAPWVDGSWSEPISDVRMMGGLANGIRRTVRHGRPAVLGWVPVGDAAATTNPAHSRGCSLGAVHAVAVADAVAADRDPVALAESCAAVVEREQAPWVADSIEQDRQRLARWRPDDDGNHGNHDNHDDSTGGAPALPAAPRLSNGEAYAAARHDAYVWRRFNRLQQLLERPDDVLADNRVIARVRAVQASGAPMPSLDGSTHADLVVWAPTPPLDGPNHAELVELLSAGAAVP